MLRLTFLLMALLAGTVQAATVTDLYQARIVLPDTDSQSEQNARRDALAQVLVKVSGQSRVVNNDVVTKALANSNPFVSQYGYGNLKGKRTLDLTFDRNRVRQLLTQAQATFWGEQRPNVLVWLVEDAESSRNIAWDQSGNPLLAGMKSEADRRGVPTMMPIGDFEDVTAISVPDLWGGFVGPIVQASQRYQPEAVLVVRARRKGPDDYVMNWQLYAEGPEKMAATKVTPSEGQASGTSEATLRRMMDHVADQLGVKYAVPLGGDESGQLAVVVSNIRSAKDFFTLERMMTNLSSVAGINAYRIQGEQVEFSVKLLSTEAAFQRELSQNSRLSEVTAPVMPAEPMEASEVQPTEAVLDGQTDSSETLSAPAKPVKQVSMYEWRAPQA
ncbi:DUF2066 domain-containing protein [Photobacterium ganghwense]|uniref:DUF2066 domain-containing protein n=1 Tax=Photobacterium ganghwense TaxID=320778 RepID=UPI00069EA97F|nr:DUF2066 domain-containing protein [Photobacterium ganghwense]QSV14696.1 DUF2066 domain-containing protein [Photobacterium ganghwense]